MRIGFATADYSRTIQDADGAPTLGGSGHYRCALPARALAAAGHETFVGGLLSHNQAVELGVRTWADGENHFDLDVLVLQRLMWDDLPDRVAECVAHGLVILNDVDDFFGGLDPSNRAFHTSSKSWNSETNREHYARTIARSTATTASTPFLADRYARSRSLLVRNAIDAESWLYAPESAEKTIGWVGALPWRSGDVETLRGILGPFCERHGFRAVHAGHLDGIRDPITAEEIPSFAERVGLDEGGVEKREMVPLAEYPSLFGGLAIGLVPLAEKGFNEAKSAIKGMEYAAAGVPFVAQATSEYRWLAERGIGRVARRPKDWIRHLEALADPAVRAEEAERNRRLVEDLGIDWLRGAWEGVLREVLDREDASAL